MRRWIKISDNQYVMPITADYYRIINIVEDGDFLHIHEQDIDITKYRNAELTAIAKQYGFSYTDRILTDDNSGVIVQPEVQKQILAEFIARTQLEFNRKVVFDSPLKLSHYLKERHSITHNSEDKRLLH